MTGAAMRSLWTKWSAFRFEPVSYAGTTNSGTIHATQQMAGHSDPRTTKLYDAEATKCL